MIGRQLVATLCGNIMTFCFGLAVGWPSPTIPKLMDPSSKLLESGPLTIDEASWISSIMCIGGACATLFFGYTSEKFGRKLSLISLAVPTLLGWLFIIYGKNPTHLYIARFLGGFGGGGSFIIVPVYVTEIANNDIRGILGSLTVLLHNIGLVISYAVCSYAHYFTVPYIGIGASVIFFVWSLMIPESPTYLMERGRTAEAEKACIWLGKEKIVSVETTTLKTEKKESFTLNDLCTRSSRRGLFLGFILITLTCSSGAFVLLHYTVSIFQQAGSSLSPEMSSVIVGSIQLLGSYVATFLVDRAGRKFLIITSSFSVAFVLTLMGAYNILDSQGINMSAFSWIPLVCLSLVVFLAANGSASLPYLVLCEVLTQKIRTFVSTICLFEDWVLAFAYVKFLPFMIAAWGLHGALWFFAAINVLLSSILLFYLPETKGKSIDEIARILSQKK
ncbi:facilitated trehalose transporter Tret1-like [Culicoides brevitarsis]|uniref:facilitated trehalose transporter Tret1-like n=1 Tax=Culicoides brevitarsis TaxID=469753 RepID=UPI00307B869E